MPANQSTSSQPRPRSPEYRGEGSLKPSAESLISNSPSTSENFSPIVNIAAYKFVELADLPERRASLQALCREHELKGTILLTPEGINLFVAGSRRGVDALLSQLRGDSALADLEVKESLSDEQPFARMLVKIKKEIIAFGIEGIAPASKTSRKIAPQELREWIESGKDIVLLDVRNNYEVGVGTFESALPVDVDNFRDFPEAIERLPGELRDKPVVMFCTGGIRCEKAGPFMEQAGFRDVFQLSGGILKYFEDVGGAHYQGECFVFDQRVALGPDLRETETKQCYACLTPLSVDDQQSPLYDPPHACPHCHLTPEQRLQKLLLQRQQAIATATSPLPGSIPYENPRPLNVPARFDGLTLLQFVQQYHPHLGDEYWAQVCNSGRIRQNGQPVPADHIVRGGEQFAHLQPEGAEPDVNADIRILHEDEALVIVQKPAPLPMHPCGRFNRNSLQWILNSVYAPLKLRPAHRLDANTTGVVVCCKTKYFSQRVQPQFERHEVEKTYQVRVQGIVPWEEFTCDAAISREPTDCGGRDITDDGLAAVTNFERVRVLDDGSTLLRAYPLSGRTNQIRLHLWHLGFPVVGDPLYRPEQQLGDTQTLSDQSVMCLHAQSITFTHPVSKARVTFDAHLPEWWVGSEEQR
ncbi:sulfurtransferase [Planctomicrobium piriforme]|uniref:tRNA uridine(34) hydroxylase n=1 Tax=Planctomicrobium piriforme TaxID=1576369 RepID=A0A1I3QZS3_9PLAN|nr:sulfurtransferase [Planctomicrobium piriforme]SFJ38647.1 pseudouridine synthase, RluA family [Planctomicrobium piriforme]